MPGTSYTPIIDLIFQSKKVLVIFASQRPASCSREIFKPIPTLYEAFEESLVPSDEKIKPFTEIVDLLLANFSSP